MNETLRALPFRLGTTSYIIPDDLLPNARFLAAEGVRDIELLLFEVDDGFSNLPSAETALELAGLAEAHGLSYTVHLPLDLTLGAEGQAYSASLEKARRVIEAARALAPWAYVAHLDGRAVRTGAGAEALRRWQDQAVRALEMVAGWAGEPNKLCVENLEGYPLDFLEPVLARSPASRCVDVGHLWLDGHDPLPYLAQAAARIRVIHLHGIDGRDHRSLANMPAKQIDALLAALLGLDYRGVVTLEVFDENDFRSSLAALEASLGRIRAG